MNGRHHRRNVCWSLLVCFLEEATRKKKGEDKKKRIRFVRNQTWKKAGKEIREYYLFVLLADKLFPS